MTWETVPNVIGDTKENAEAAIVAAGFAASVREIYSTDIAAGLVISQNPLPDTSALYGGKVYIVVSLGVQAEASTGFTKSPWKTCAQDGSAFIGVAFVDGKAGYTAKTTGSARVRRIEVRYQSHDKRTIRGGRPMPNNEE